MDLLESTLFGHVRGAFTGRRADPPRAISTSPTVERFFSTKSAPSASKPRPSCLRVIQEREFVPVGSTDTIKIDVRIVAATNDNLEKLVQEGTFREDLYYRLNVIQINLPPLRERVEDIPLLAEHFFDKYCRENERFLDSAGRSTLRFSPAAMKLLMNHNWPGNVRELENVVERATVLATQPEVSADLLPESLARTRRRRANAHAGDL